MSARIGCAAGFAVILAVVVASNAPVAGQAPAAAAKPAATAPKAPAAAPATPAKKYVAPRNAEGQPDLTGVWAYGTATPLERPNGQDKPELDEEEVAAAASRAQSRNFDDR